MAFDVGLGCDPAAEATVDVSAEPTGDTAHTKPARGNTRRRREAVDSEPQLRFRLEIISITQSFGGAPGHLNNAAIVPLPRRAKQHLSVLTTAATIGEQHGRRG